MSFMKYQSRKRFTDYDKRVLEALIEGKKNIYQICKEVQVKKKKTPYPTIKRSVEKLEKEKLVKMIKKGVRNSKIYVITLLGIAMLYFTKRDRQDPLQFHNSTEAQDILNKFINEFFKVKNEKIKNHFFIKALKLSPSLTENALYLPYMREPITLRDSSLFKEIVDRSIPARYIHYKQLDEDTLHLNFLSRAYPLIFLAKDYLSYPDKNEIRKLLIEGVIKANISTGNRIIEMRMETFQLVIEAIQKGIIDLKGSLIEQQEKFKEYVAAKEDELWEKVPRDQWFIYIPPGGEPVLACSK